MGSLPRKDFRDKQKKYIRDFDLRREKRKENSLVGKKANTEGGRQSDSEDVSHRESRC